MPALGMAVFGASKLQAELLALAAKTGQEAMGLARMMAQEMVSMASVSCPVSAMNGGRLKSTIQTSSTGIYSAAAEVGRGVPYTLYAEFYVTKGHEIRNPSGRFWYPSLGKLRKRLHSELLDTSGEGIIGVTKG
jgi:hypothetical protein